MSDTQQRIPEDVVPGKRLGRHIYHDPRSLRFPFKTTTTLVSKRWSTDNTPILDQGDLGSCTGNATVGALLCQPFSAALPTDLRLTLNEDLAVKIYSRATETDAFDGTYKPDDTGSDGLDAAKAAREFGFISGFTHALSLNDALAALTVGPIIVGINWYSGMDNPTGTGAVTPGGSIRGGHEICFDEIDTTNKIVWFRNSWSLNWGVAGRAFVTFDNFGKLLAADGDVTVFAPVNAPAPTPIPVPPSPTPPSPTSNVDQTLADVTRAWAAAPHTGSNKRAAQAVSTWAKARGL